MSSNISMLNHLLTVYLVCYSYSVYIIHLGVCVSCLYELSCMLQFLCMSVLSGLMDKVQDLVPTDQQPELLENLSEGSFTLGNMYDLYKNLVDSGSIDQVFPFLLDIFYFRLV